MGEVVGGLSNWLLCHSQLELRLSWGCGKNIYCDSPFLCPYPPHPPLSPVSILNSLFQNVHFCCLASSFLFFRLTKIIHFLTSLVTTILSILSIQRPVKSDISIRYGTAVRQLLIMLPELSKYSDKVICGADHTAGKNWRQEVPGLTRMARGQDSSKGEY